MNEGVGRCPVWVVSDPPCDVRTCAWVASGNSHVLYPTRRGHDSQHDRRHYHPLAVGSGGRIFRARRRQGGGLQHRRGDRRWGVGRRGRGPLISLAPGARHARAGQAERREGRAGRRWRESPQAPPRQRRLCPRSSSAASSSTRRTPRSGRRRQSPLGVSGNTPSRLAGNRRRRRPRCPRRSDIGAAAAAVGARVLYRLHKQHPRPSGRTAESRHVGGTARAHNGGYAR